MNRIFAALALACALAAVSTSAFAGAGIWPFGGDGDPNKLSLMVLPAIAVAITMAVVVICSMPALARRISIALIATIALAGCQTLDTKIAEVSDRLATRCGDLKAAIVVVDLFAPEKLRAAIGQGEVVLNTVCAKPPRSAADLTIAIGETIKALQAIEAAKRG